MKKLAHILAVMAGALGLKALEIKEGKLDISDEQRAKLESIYGSEILREIESAASEGKSAETLLENLANLTKAKDAEIAQLKEEKSRLQADVKTLSQQPEPQPQAQKPAALAAGTAKKFDLNAGALHNKLAAQALAGGFAPAMATAATATLDTSDLRTEFGAVMPANTRIEILAKRIYNGFDDAKYFRKITSNTNYKATSALMTEVSQQFTPAWTPKGSAKFTPIEIVYRRHKINVKLKATDILESWLQYLYEQGKTPAEMPIVKYIIENHVLPKVTDDITLAMVAKGSFVDHNDGSVADGDAGFAAKDSMDGIETILVNGKSDSSCKMNFFKNALDYTTLTAAELLAYVDSFVDAISPLFSRIFNVYCSPEFLTAYRRADFEVNGKYTNAESDGKIRFTSFNLVALKSMYGSKILFATPADNMVMLVDYAKAESCINMIQVENYDVKIFGEYSLSVGFLIAEAVYAAIPDGYTPSVATDPLSASDAWENGQDPNSGTEAGSGEGSGSGAEGGEGGGNANPNANSEGE